ncbi:hypothetical protein BJ508DRAFT_308318 [Ascobolus immersus RN42]|uniref:Uncharacterized protein n=1 Tax=Ascobolus immersus RN42 TaxID=1160509 RepID=A0A3N4I2C3_ASCIM|nr:hypothetical protein BJ508DRAFT_308318 [Ascobolus immersus RN42]
MAVRAHLKNQALTKILNEAGILLPLEDCERFANGRPTFERQQQEYKSRERMRQDDENRQRMQKYLNRRDLTVQKICISHGPWHKGVIKCAYDASYPLNRMNPSRTEPQRRQLVELEYRQDFNLAWKVCVLSPKVAGSNRRYIYGWATTCSDNAYPEDNILALKAGGHRIRGYIIPGDSFKLVEQNAAVEHQVKQAISDEVETVALAPAADKWKSMRERMARMSRVERIEYVVHFRADCPDDIDLARTYF